MASDQVQDLFQTWFCTICKDLRNNLNLEKVSSDFGQLKSDEERISFAWQLPAIHRVIKVCPTFDGKSAARSVALRNQGNGLFKKKLYHKAVLLYTNSILKAPAVSEGRELALAFANRSAAFFSLEDYCPCLQDIECALVFDYPDELKYKLSERRGKCMGQLGRQQEAIKHLSEAKKHLESSNLDSKKKGMLERNLENEIKLVKSISDQKSNHKEHCDSRLDQNFKSLSLVDGKNKIFMSASSAVGISHDRERGRYPIANRDIKAGETLVIDPAFASVLLPENNTHCHHCYKWIAAAVPCFQCSRVQYCSLLCAKQSWTSYHSVECNYLDLIHAAGVGHMAHLALRIIGKTGFTLLREFKQNIEAEEENGKNPVSLGCSKAGVYDPSSYSTIYHLISHSADRSVSDMFHRTVMAVFLVKCLEAGGFYPQNAVMDLQSEQIYTGSLILRHLQSLPCNAHEVAELELDRQSVGTSQTREVAAAIYATMSLFNHSCDPDITRNFYGDTCVVRAIKNIPAGKEIVDNYGTLYAVESKADRHAKLEGQYYFTCSCQACRDDWPLYEELVANNVPVFKCEVCRSSLKSPISVGVRSSYVVNCPCCGKNQDIQSKILLLERSEEEYSKAMSDLLEHADVDKALPTLVTHLRLLDNLVCAPWKDINNCQEAIKQCYNIMANCHVLEISK